LLTDEQVQTLIDNIAQLGGQAFKEEDIVYEGSKLVIPEQFKGQLDKAVKFIQDKNKEENEDASFSRTYKYRPWDGAYCAFKALKDAFGLITGQATYNWLFGKQPPQYIQVPISSTETAEVPWGQFTVPVIEGIKFTFGEAQDKELGKVFRMTAVGPRKQRFVVEGLFKLVEKELQSSSIYKGKAIDGQEQPQFLDLRGIDTTRIIYSNQVQADLEAHIWSVVRYPAAYRSLGMPLKRAILLFGPYGTGKSLAGLLTALECEKYNWTFLMARPGRDDFLQVMQTARLYQPACVFFEDAETVAGAGEKDTISEVLDVFDGIQSKATSLMVVLTTNHPEMIHKGMHRPGRVDAQIEIGALDAGAIQRLITRALPPENLADDIDWEQVVEANADYVPAFVAEGAARAIRYALPRNNGELKGITIDTLDLVNAAGGLRPQFERMMEAPETKHGELSLSTMVEQAARRAVAALATPHDEDPYAQVWNPEALAIEQEMNARR
jgi:transitional endoplasmic reticulum ATPase